MIRRYRLKIYDGQYEVLRKHLFHVDVDLDSPARAGILYRELSVLTELASIANEPMDRPVLQVCDPVTGKPLLSWV